MSKNNQLLVKEYNGEFLTFSVMAESWGDGENEIAVTARLATSPTRTEAHKVARFLDKIEETEYGVIDEVLAKDGASVVIKEG